MKIALSHRTAALAFTACVAHTAAVAADPAPAAPSPAPAPAAAPASTSASSDSDDAKFSGKRFVVEILAGAVVGSLAGYGTYSALCDGKGDCLGASLAGAGMNFAITPLAVWGTGRWMHGRGSLGWTYLGASAALSPLSVPGSPDESPSDAMSRISVEFAISTFLLPVTSATFFELSSHMEYARAHQASFAIAPTYDRDGHVAGAMGHLALRF